MNHNALLTKKQPADWSKAPSGATHFYRMRNGVELFTDKEVKESFIHESVIDSGQFRIVYTEKRPQRVTTIHAHTKGGFMRFEEIPGELTYDEAVKMLREDKIYTQDMRVMLTYKDCAYANAE